MSLPGQSAIFLSYASQDAEAARRICDTLRAAGIEVWFDADGGLEHGDEWDAKIRRQIKECVLFIPIISANTQAREEGYFRLEWDLAAERARTIASGVPFILPVVIDDTRDADALVPDRFRAVQWTKLPGGVIPPEVRARYLKLWSHRTGALRQTHTPVSVPADTPDPRATATPPGRHRGVRGWRALAMGGIALAAGVVLWLVFRPAPIAPVRAAAPAVAAATDFPHHPDLKRARTLIYAVDSIPGDFALAEDLVKPLVAAQPNDPEVVTVAAEISAEYLIRGFDTTTARHAQAQRLSERAVQLAPDNPAALAALGRYLRNDRTQLGRAEEVLRRAVALSPNEPRYYRYLYSVLILTKPGAETEAFGARMAALFPKDPLVAYEMAVLHLSAGDLAAAEAAFDQTLQLAPVANAITSKARLMLEVHGDVNGMKLWLDRMPERQRTNARLAIDYAVVALITGQTEPARRIVESITDAWIADGNYVFPRAMLLGELEAIDHHDDVARLDYEAALEEIRRVQHADPTDLRPQRAELWVQLALGHRTEALAALRVNLQKAPHPYRWRSTMWWWTGAPRACLLLDQREPALALLKEAVAEPQGRLMLRNLFQADPKMAPFRDDPEIAALFADPKPPSAAAPSEATQLVAHAKALYTKYGYTHEDLVTAEELARRATEKEPDSAAAWGALAAVHATYLQRSWDTKAKRRQDAQSAATRALGLNPDEVEALWALGRFLLLQGAAAQAETNARHACALAPADSRMTRSLADVFVAEGRRDEARALLLAAIQRAPRDPLLRYDVALSYASWAFAGGRDPTNLAAALEHLDAGIAAEPLGGLLLNKAMLLAGWRGDLAGMRATLDQLAKVPLVERTEDRAVYVAMWGGLLEHNAARVLAAAGLTAKSYFDDTFLPRQPKDWTIALAHHAAGKENLARLDWQHAEAAIRARLHDDPDNQNLTCELAITLAWLDRVPEATALLAPLEAAWREDPTTVHSRYLAQYYAAVGDIAHAAPYLARTVDSAASFTRKVMPLDPWWDKIRGAPEFTALLAEPVPQK